MQHTFQIDTQKPDLKFINSIKSIFGKKEVKIIVQDVEHATFSDNQEKRINENEVRRFLDHRKNRPSILVKDSTDFNSIVDDLNL